MTKWVWAILGVAVALAGCSGNQILQFAGTVDGADIERIHVASARGEEVDEGRYGLRRTNALRYLAYDVSVPPGHEDGEIEWPTQTADPARHFSVAASGEYAGVSEFLSDVSRAGTGKEVFVFVHGYNTSHAQAVYRAAQMSADFDVPGPGILFSWPSAGKVSAYVYDRDSVLVARDRLAGLFRDLRRSGRKIAIVGHSMGTYLIMEAMRYLALDDDRATMDAIAAVLLISPDLDTEVFRAQASAIGELPRPFFIAGTPQDRALRLSAFLTGKEGRLGSLRDPNALADLNVSTLDVSDFADGSGGDHSVLLTSPTAIAMLRALDEQYDLFEPTGSPGQIVLESVLPGIFSPIVEELTDPG